MVKRYSFDEGDEAYYDAHGFLPEGFADLVLASDYDALAAELAALQLYCAGSSQTIDMASKRIRELEAFIDSLHASTESDVTLLAIEKFWRDSAAETPAHLKGPIIQAYADTNGVPPAETKAKPLPSGCSPPGLYEVHTIGGTTPAICPHYARRELCPMCSPSDRGAAK
jgi:hypothetical protein